MNEVIWVGSFQAWDSMMLCPVCGSSCFINAIYLTGPSTIHVDNLKVIFVSEDELPTQSTSGELPGQSLQEKVAVATSLCIPGPWVWHLNREEGVASSGIVIVIKAKIWQRAVYNYEVLLWFYHYWTPSCPAQETTVVKH